MFNLQTQLAVNNRFTAYRKRILQEILRQIAFATRIVNVELLQRRNRSEINSQFKI